MSDDFFLQKVDEVLPRMDQLGRPIGDMFNLHPEYSRVFVGGFPYTGEDKPRIQVIEMFKAYN